MEPERKVGSRERIKSGPKVPPFLSLNVQISVMDLCLFLEEIYPES
jgi:hypothetical protein